MNDDFQILQTNAYVDLYCERTGPGFWNEPVNATSNIVFLIVAFAAWKLARKEKSLSSPIQLLLGLTLGIGVGSFLFHTLATRWAMVLDVLPILLFKLVFIWNYCRHVLKWNLATIVTGGITLLAVSLVGLQYKQVMNGSLLYLPGCLLLIGFGGLHIQHDFPARWSLMIAALLLVVAFVFRTTDLAFCGTPFMCGTHFLWHLFAGGVIYFTLRCLIVNLPRPGTNLP